MSIDAEILELGQHIQSAMLAIQWMAGVATLGQAVPVCDANHFRFSPSQL
jgi:hypothetical protein